MKRVTITLPDDLAELVDSEAQRRQTSVSEVIRGFITLGLAESPERPREIPWAGLFNDPGMTPAEHLDEFLAKNWANPEIVP
jgi:Arc/MetJ-type ribon-helix-helix transcriptional regulator